MGTLFSKIVSGEIPSHKIAENEQFLAFLDINPLVKGHTLVIPKKETDYIFDIADQEYQDLWIFAKQVAKKLEAKIECERIGIAVIGLEVAHAHIHLVPIRAVEDINFAGPKLSLSQSELAEIAESIRA
jgi:histidine triad (HIT) family protein